MAADKLHAQLRAGIPLVLAAIVWAILPSPVLAQGSQCRSADSVTAMLIGHVRKYTTASSGDNQQVRVALKLPFTSSLAVVTNSTTCKKARDAFVAEYGAQGTGMPSSIYVVSVGKAYAIVAPGYKYNGQERPGLWPFIYFVDSKFKTLSTLAG